MKTLIVLFAVVSCFAGLDALCCHSCIGGGSGDCNDPYTANYSITCGSGSDTCLKSVSTLDGTVTAVTRSCTSDFFCTETCISFFSAETCTYCCTSDDCNAAGAVTSNLALLLTGAVGAFLGHL